MAKSKQETLVASAIVIDETLHRTLNNYLVQDYYLSMQAGIEFPPALVEKGTNRLVDGHHRIGAWKKSSGEGADTLIPVDWRTYPTEHAFALAVAAANAAHGARWSHVDCTRLITELEQRGIEPLEIAHALHLSADRYTELKSRRAFAPDGTLQALKPSTMWLAGQTLTVDQVRANKMATFPITRLAREITTHLRCGTVDLSDQETALALSTLYQTLMPIVRQPVPA